ncbi:protein dopey-1 isoform X2 [Hyalella azteca]|uniref:Protein dopey-1 isoform X2 n=1 Tax=Hyalella azteca TaxID=294128 RepID=A0A8B7NKC1_HYAAZ|nr:protein dopey-1 isoform X2 [Hyalella azteca]
MASLCEEEARLLNDSKYRSYVAVTDKVLKAFENTSEWADLISTLAKLNKVLVSHSKYPVVPRRVIISKRLAQCMHPALPSGVHLKALETYDIIFKNIGTRRLGQELFIYSAGLFPLFVFAAMSVRSALLTIYETHFVPLGQRLRPGLNGFLSGVLPGLEEGSDHLERTSRLLQLIAEGVGHAEFFGSLWECIAGNGSSRLPALNHIVSCYNKKLSTEDQLHILGTNLDTMVSGLCSCLVSGTVLVQRAALDLALVALPLHNSRLLLPHDSVRLVSAALLALLRRDTSLNRRLFSWLLGEEQQQHDGAAPRLELPNGRTSHNDSYFTTFSKPLLTEGILCCFRESKGRVPPDLRPYKLLVCLLDRPELGHDLLDNVLLDLLRCLYHSCEALKKSSTKQRDFDTGFSMNCAGSWSGKVPPSGDYANTSSNDCSKALSELNKSAGLVLGAVQPWYPWQQLLIHLQQCDGVSTHDQHSDTASQLVKCVGCGRTTFSELCTLMEHLMQTLPLDTPQQMEAAKLMNVLFVVTEFMAKRMDVLSAKEINTGVTFCHELLQKLMTSVAVSGPSSPHIASDNTSLCDRSGASSRLGSISTLDNEPTSSVSGGLEENIKALRGAPNDAMDLPAPRSLLNYAAVFEQFFTAYVTKRLLSHECPISKFEDVLLHEQDRCSSSEVRELLHECLACSQETSQKEVSPSSQLSSRQTGSHSSRASSLGQAVRLTDNHLEELPTFDYACVVLIDLSSIPISSEKAHQLSLMNGLKEVTLGLGIPRGKRMFDSLAADMNSDAPSESSEVANCSDGAVPAWLVALLACGCCGDQCTALQHSALATLCELVMVAASEVSVWRVQSQQTQSAINIVPRLLPEHVHVLHHNTGFYQHVTLALWSQLRQPHKPSQVRSVELLLRLHSITSLAAQSASLRNNKVAATRRPSSPSLVERELLAALSASCRGSGGGQVDQVSAAVRPAKEMHQQEVRSGVELQYQHDDASERWLTLWQLSRHCSSVSSARVAPHSFDRCLFLLLEWLRAPGSRQRTLAQQWLCAGLGCGDAARILDPVLCLLLHPHTRRISVQHVTVTPLGSNALLHTSCERGADANNDSASESLIYAISSVGGDVMYHVSKDVPNSFQSKKFFSPSAKQILALTTLMNDKLITENVQMPEYEVPYMGSSDDCHMSVLVNPFSRHPWLEMEDMADMNKASLSSAASESPATELQDAAETSMCQDLSNDEEQTSQGGISCEEGTLSAREIAESVFNEILERVFVECSLEPMPSDEPESSSIDSMEAEEAGAAPALGGANCNLTPSDMTLHPLHSHMLLYTQLVDSGQCLYGLTLLKNILESQAKLSLLSFASTGISVQQSHSELLVLMARHKQCVLGQGFDSGNSSELLGQYRSVMYLQVLITVCLYYIRSYYPQLPHLRLNNEHLQDNKEVQVLAVEILELVFSNLIPLVNESPRGLAPYVQDLLHKCKVQKCVLYCLLATVHAMRLPSSVINNKTSRAHEAKTFTQELLDYNYKSNNELSASAHETYLLNIMNLTLSLIKLEDVLKAAKVDPMPKKETSSSRSQSFAQYQPGQPIPTQAMFLRVVFSALGQKHTRHLHSAWLRLFTSTLPYMGNALPNNALRTSSFLCILLEELPQYYSNPASSSMRPIPPDYTLTLISALTTIVHFCLLDQTTPTMISGAPYLGSTHKPSNFGSSSSSTSATNAPASSHSTGNMLFNILNVFSPVADALEDSLDAAEADPLNAARKTLLCHLPRLVATLLPLWSATTSEVQGSAHCDIVKQYYEMELQCIAGSRSTVMQHIINFLSPICHHHAADFLAAVSIVWQSLSDSEAHGALAGRKQSAGEATEATSLAKAASCQSLMQTPSDADEGLPRPRSSTAPKKRNKIKNLSSSNSLQDVHKFGLFLDDGGVQRRGSHPTELDFVVETATKAIDMPHEVMRRHVYDDEGDDEEVGDALSVSLVDQLLAVHQDRRALMQMVSAVRVLPLHLFLDTVKQVLRQPPALQGSSQSVEVAVLEVLHCFACCSSPEQLGASWKPLISLLKEAVLALPPEALLLLLPILNNFVQRAPPITEKRLLKELQDVSVRLVESVSNIAGSCLEATAWLRRSLTVKARRDETQAWRVSVRALELLASEVAALLDVLYTSDEKDKVLPFLTQLMGHVTPYLRDHTANNARPFLACSRLVASLSGHQYTLKAWRKDVLELLLDVNAFRMSRAALSSWKTIVDNLFTHDKTIFKELIVRVTPSQGGSLHLFTSREAEYASRAVLLKRLAFTIFCSEPDQYSKFFPDIQERVTEVSRLGEMVPVLVGAVLGLVGVLVVRMAPRAMVSLWPVIITEMVQVFQVMEQQLQLNNHTNSAQQGKRLPAMDGRCNNLHQPAWLSLYLAACKLLDLLLALPVSLLPQFQMYRWAFVGTSEGSAGSCGDVAVTAAPAPLDGPNAGADFVPHVRRIARLMALRRQSEAGSEQRSAPVSLDVRSGHLLLGSVASIASLQDLEPFFQRLANSACELHCFSTHSSYGATQTQGLDHIERQLEASFVEPLLENL